MIKENEVEDLDTKWTVQKVKDYLFNSECSAEIIEEFRQDHRKGVQKLLVQYDRKQAQIAKAIRHFEHMSSYEKKALGKGQVTYCGNRRSRKGTSSWTSCGGSGYLTKRISTDWN